MLQQLLEPQHPEWVDAKAKAKISSLYGSDKGQIYLRIRKDSVVWAAVKRLSIEGGRALINSDSSFFINRLDKTWSSMSLMALQNRYGLISDINYIQNVMTGLPPKIDTTRYFESELQDDFFVVKSDIDGILHKFKFDRSNGHLSSCKFETQYGISGWWEFSDYRQASDDCILPYKRVYHIDLNQEETFDLELDFSNIELNIPKEIKFEIPGHYSKI